MNRRNFLAFASGPLLSAAIGLLILPISAWLFPAVDVGRNAILQVALSLTVLVFVLGLDQAFVREYHEHLDWRSLFKSCFAPSFIALCSLAALSIPFARQLTALMYEDYRPLWYPLTVGCCVLAYINRFFSLLLRVQERGAAFAASQVLPKITLLGTLGAYAAVGVDAEFAWLLAANLLAMLCATIVLMWSLREQLLLIVRAPLAQTPEILKLLRFGTPLIGVGLATWALTSMGAVGLRTFSTLEQLATYSVTISLAGIGLVLQSALATVWMPTVYKWVARGENLERIESAARWVTAICCVLGSVVGALAWTLDWILPSDYSQAKFLLPACILQSLLYTITETTAVGINVQRRSLSALVTAISCLILNAIGCIVLIPRLGAAGAAISSGLSYAAYFVIRTEISAATWRSIPRFRIYVGVSVLTSLSVLTAVSADFDGGYHWQIFVWAVTAVMFLALYKHDLRQFYEISVGTRSRRK